jgi:predicted DNA-binding protein (MmcQ/YjbR family)
MDIEQVRAHCLSFPHVTESVQWGNDLVFKIGGKMFAVTVLEGASKYCLSFKCTPEKFAELTEEDGIDPAPYLARYHWVALQRFNVLSEKELKGLLRNGYDLVLEKLPKKVRAELEGKGYAKKIVLKRR